MNSLTLTPIEAAKITNIAVGGGADETDRVKEFISVASTRELQEYIHNLSSPANSQLFYVAKVALNISLADDAAKTADKLSQQTDKLIQHTEQLTKQTDIHIQHSEKLTRQTDILVTESRRLRRLNWGLIILTLGLLFLTAGLLWIDWHRHIQGITDIH